MKASIKGKHPMWRIKRVRASLLGLLFAGCTLVVDFRDAPGDAGAPDSDDAGAPDAADPRDSGRDAAAPDGSLCDPGSHAGCRADQLCCDRGDGAGARCVAVGPDACSACGLACPIGAPQCRDRVCECVAGSGAACASDQRCAGEAGQARCIECSVDAECAARPGRPHCVAERCEACDRGALANDADDDEGCAIASAPICGPDNTCIGCSSDPDDCPGALYCNAGAGCFVCSLAAPVGSNGCSGTTPICRPSAGGAACAACQTNPECAGGFCVVATGACTSACDPAVPPGANGCSGSAPFCKPQGADFACQACAASDCSGFTPHCASSGPRRGNCVACRTSADCAPDGPTPTCDLPSGLCVAL